MLSNASETRKRLVKVARGLEEGDLLIRGAQVVQPATKEIFESDILIADGRIAALGGGYTAKRVIDVKGAYVAPGFIDAHVHIESSLLAPAGFAAAVLPRGTTAVVAEPHEIVNVLGAEGLSWMLESGKKSGMRVFASVPSCVPASQHECGGVVLDAQQIASMLRLPGVLGLAEMMNYPGVLGLDSAVWDILAAGGASGLRIDGHAAGVTGRDLMAYAAAGMHSDHEATTPEQATERLRAGLWLMVREGSAARDLGALMPALQKEPRRAMLVSDDVSVDELLALGHLDRLLKRCVASGLHPAYAVSLVTCNPAEYWGMHDLGLIAPGYHADFVILEDLKDFKVLDTFVAGAEAKAGTENIALSGGGVNYGRSLGEVSFDVPKHWPVMEVRATQITTGAGASGTGDAKLVAADRYGRGEWSACWTSGTGLTGGTLAISILHDSHHVVMLGGSNSDMQAAAGALENMGGGIVVVRGGEVVAKLPLPYGGLMTDLHPKEASRLLGEVTSACKEMGCVLPYPVTTLSFLGLSVIPSLKLTPRGLLDVEAWEYLPS